MNTHSEPKEQKIQKASKEPLKHLKELEVIKEKLHRVQCIVMILESDLSMEQPDGVATGAVTTIKDMIRSIQQDLQDLL